jgi:glycosyltransferase involved in cell wall biosynthesis
MAWAWTSDLPFQVVWFTERRAQREVRLLLENTSPDVVYCQLVRCTEYVKDIHHLPKVLDYMDALSAGMHRRAQSDSNGWLRPLRWLFRSEGTRLARYESRVFDYFDAHTIISRNDRLLIPHRDRDHIELVPNGVDLSAFSPAAEAPSAAPVLLFTGNMSYAPNVDAAQHLVKDILPRIQHPNVRVVLAGANPKPSIKALAGDRVTVTGWVDDIAQEYREAALFVAPLRIGTGLQNKVLEAMACELPCVLSPHAFAPLNLPSAGHAAVCHDAAEFAATVDELLAAPNQAKSMARAARDVIQTSFAWKTHATTLTNLLSRVVASPSNSVSRN